MKINIVDMDQFLGMLWFLSVLIFFAGILVGTGFVIKFLIRAIKEKNIKRIIIFSIMFVSIILISYIKKYHFVELLKTLYDH